MCWLICRHVLVDMCWFTITGSYNELDDTSLLPLAFALKKKGFAVSFRRKSLFCLMLLFCGDIESCPGPDIAGFLNTKGFSVFHQNIRGLHGKKEIISDILYNNSKIDIFSLSETFITHTDFFNAEIRGYAFESKARQNGTGGGVCAYIKDGVPYTRRVDLERGDLELVWLEISFTNCKSFFLVGVLYRPPDTSKHTSKNFQKSLRDVLNITTSENKEAIILGDINCDYLKDKDHKTIKDLFITHGYKQLIDKATGITEQSETLIDVILTNSPETIRKHDTILSSNSDHDIICIIRKKSTPKYRPNVIYSRNYKNYDANKIRTELKNTNWQVINECHDSNICWKFFKDILTRCINTHAPMTKKTVKGKPIPWLTEEIKKQMNDRDGLLRKARKSKNTEHWKNYKAMKNRTNNSINRAKEKYH